RPDGGPLPVQTQQAAGGHGLARSGFPDNAEAAAGAQGEGDIVHDRLAVEGHLEVLGGDQCGHRAAPASDERWRWRPITVSERVNRTIVMPAKKSIHQAVWR